MLDALRAWWFEQKVRRTDGVDDVVADAMFDVRRERFLDDDVLRPHAFVDASLPTGPNTPTSQPSYVARVISAGHVRPRDRVLEVGTGIGFAAAIIAKLAREVVTVERVEALAARARVNLAAEKNVSVVVGDAWHCRDVAGPFDVIFVMCGAPRIPEPALALLADGGRLVVPVGIYEGEGRGVTGRLLRVTRTHEGAAPTTTTEDLGATSFNPLFGADGF
jgi:protein-L-isoaspartate(D-aspartate) O-methyltransferase